MVNGFWFAAMVVITAPIQAGQPIAIYEGHAEDAPKQPQAFVSATGTTHLTFGIGNQVHYSHNADGEFHPPGVAFQVPNLSLGMRRGPRIADTGKSIVITAIGGSQGKGKDGDVLSYRSDDQGKTWAGPVRVNDVEASAREGLHAMTATENGVLWCVWLDLRAKKTELYASKSVDDGRSWSNNQLVYRSPDGSVCECCHPSIAATGDSIHILFRNSLDGNRDMYLVSSSDQGTSFGPALRLGSDHWSLNACPMDGGMLTAPSGGKITTVWRRGGMIYTSAGKTLNESVLGKGEQAWVAANSAGTYVVWTSSREGALFFAELGTNKSEKLADNARDPIVVSGSGSTPFAQVFWEQREGGKTSIMSQRIRLQ